MLELVPFPAENYHEIAEGLKRENTPVGWFGAFLFGSTLVLSCCHDLFFAFLTPVLSGSRHPCILLVGTLVENATDFQAFR
jgi:hypothetical protein